MFFAAEKLCSMEMPRNPIDLVLNKKGSDQAAAGAEGPIISAFAVTRICLRHLEQNHP